MEFEVQNFAPHKVEKKSPLFCVKVGLSEGLQTAWNMRASVGRIARSGIRANALRRTVFPGKPACFVESLWVFVAKRVGFWLA